MKMLISKHLGLSAEIFSACVIWKYFKSLGVAKIFSAYMIWSPISKHFWAGHWNILSLYDMKAYIKTFGLSAEIFSAYIIWKYIKTFGGSGIILSLCHLEVYQNFRGWGAEIFSACVISKYIKTFRAGVLKYSQPVSSGSISKHLGWVLKYS